MNWRLAVNHATEYAYEGDVFASYNESRITPRRDDRQLVLDHRVDVKPGVRMLQYTDYWGSEVCAFSVHERHQTLVVTGRSLVETPSPLDLSHTRDWPDVTKPEIADEFHEFLAPSHYVSADDRVRTTAIELAAGRTPRETVDAVMAWTRENMVYETGATDVSTTAVEALALGRGVCQDFVHIAIAVLRAAGIPARYASGYLHPDGDAEIGSTVVGQSHAWLETWVGGWLPADPTNGAEVGPQHVLVARGRDYSDVVPLKGVFHGPPVATVDVRVEIERVA